MTDSQAISNQEKESVSLDMSQGKYSCAIRTLEAMDKTLHMLKAPDVIKSTLHSDIARVKDIIQTSKRGKI